MRWTSCESPSSRAAWRPPSPGGSARPARLRAVAFLTAVVSPSSGGARRIDHGQRLLGHRIARQLGGQLPGPGSSTAPRRAPPPRRPSDERAAASCRPRVSVAAYTSSSSRCRSSSARHSARPRRFSEIRRSGCPGCESVATAPSGRTRSIGPLLRSRRTLTTPAPAAVRTRRTGALSASPSQAASSSVRRRVAGARHDRLGHRTRRAAVERRGEEAAPQRDPGPGEVGVARLRTAPPAASAPRAGCGTPPSR